MLSVSLRRSVILLLKPEQWSKRKELIRLLIAWPRLLWNSKQKLPTSRGDSILCPQGQRFCSFVIYSLRGWPIYVVLKSICSPPELEVPSRLSAAANVRDNSWRKVSILGGQCEGIILCKHVHNSKWLPRERERERERAVWIYRYKTMWMAIKI